MDAPNTPIITHFPFLEDQCPSLLLHREDIHIRYAPRKPRTSRIPNSFAVEKNERISLVIGIKFTKAPRSHRARIGLHGGHQEEASRSEEGAADFPPAQRHIALHSARPP